MRNARWNHGGEAGGGTLTAERDAQHELVCVPDDDDGAVEATLGRLEEVLSVLHEIEEEDLREGFTGTVPAQLRGGRALEAVRSIACPAGAVAAAALRPGQVIEGAGRVTEVRARADVDVRLAGGSVLRFERGDMLRAS